METARRLHVHDPGGRHPVGAASPGPVVPRAPRPRPGRPQVARGPRTTPPGPDRLTGGGRLRCPGAAARGTRSNRSTVVRGCYPPTSGNDSTITAANAAGERSAASRNAAWIARDAPALPRTSTRPGGDRPPGPPLDACSRSGSDPLMPRVGAAAQPDLAVVQHRRAGRDRPVPGGWRPAAGSVSAARPAGCGPRSARTRRSRPRQSTRDTSRSPTRTPPLDVGVRKPHGRPWD